MQLTLAGQSALAFWIWAAQPDNCLLDLSPNVRRQKPSSHFEIAQGAPLKVIRKRERKCLPKSFKISVKRAETDNLLRELNQTGPLHVLVQDASMKRNREGIQTQCMLEATRVRAFYEIFEGFYVCAPELAFAHLCSQLPRTYLTMLGYELCGEYAIDDNALGGFIARPSLMTKDDVKNLFAVWRAPNQKKMAMRAIGDVLEKTASPAESQLAALLTLPTRAGGFGFPAPQANAAVLQDACSQKISGKQWRACDLFWERELVDVEYDSEAHHSTREQRFRDSVRRNALTSAGIKVISVTPNQLQSVHEMRTVAQALARALGKRIRVRINDYELRQCKLHKTVMQSYPKWRRDLLSKHCDKNDVSSNETEAALDDIEIESFYELP